MRPRQQSFLHCTGLLGAEVPHRQDADALGAQEALHLIILFFLRHLLGPWFFIVMMVYAGVGFGYVAPYSMVPDAIEADAVATGVRKEGAFYGMWLFTSKIGSAFLIAALVLVQFYPLDEKKYAELIASKPKP